jgi:antitoxin ChpS
MVTSNLLKIGDTVMLKIPPTIFDELNLKVGAAVQLKVDNNHLILSSKPIYSLTELLSKCNGSVELSLEDRRWLESSAIGNELF